MTNAHKDLSGSDRTDATLIGFLCSLSLSLLWLIPISAQAQPTSPPATAPVATTTAATAPTTQTALPLSPAQRETQLRTERLWKMHWKNYAQRFALVGDQYYNCSGFDPRFPSSAGITVAQVASARSAPVADVGLVYDRGVAVPPDIDNQAKAMSLPNLALGEYGYVLSVRVAKILGPDEMAVNDIRLLDVNALDKAKQEAWRKARGNYQLRQKYVDWAFKGCEDAVKRQREWQDVHLIIKGVPTQDIATDIRWTGRDRNQGLQLVLVDTASFEDEGGPTRFGQPATPRQRQVFVAIPSSHFIKGLTEEQFRTMLEKRGWTIAQFVQLVLEENQRDKNSAIERVSAALTHKPSESDKAEPGRPVGATP